MPKYLTIAKTVAAEITDGHFQTGERIYSIKRIAPGSAMSRAMKTTRSISWQRIGRMVR